MLDAGVIPKNGAFQEHLGGHCLIQDAGPFRLALRAHSLPSELPLMPSGAILTDPGHAVQLTESKLKPPLSSASSYYRSIRSIARLL